MAANETEGDYRIQGKLGEGTFSQVLRMKHRVTGRTLAMKRFKKRFKSIEEVECLREIQALKRVNPHPNLVQMEDILFDPGTGTLYLAFELMDCNLYDLISKKGAAITEPKVKLWFFQICKGLEFLHAKGIFHRDIKPENILIRDGVLVKLADLGSCRGIHSKGPFTEYIATRWYRSPETLLTSGRYNYKMDMWGAGCVLYETVTKQPLFPGSDALDQLHKIHRVFGSPSDAQLRAILGPKLEGKFTFPRTDGTGLSLAAPYDGECRSLLLGLLAYLPEDRFSAPQCLAHEFLKNVDLSDLPAATIAVYRGHASASTAAVEPAPAGTGAAKSVVTEKPSHHAHLPPAASVPPAAAPSAAAYAAGGLAAHDDLALSRDKLTEGYLTRLLLRRKKEGGGGGNGGATGVPPKPSKPPQLLPNLAPPAPTAAAAHHVTVAPPLGVSMRYSTNQAPPVPPNAGVSSHGKHGGGGQTVTLPRIGGPHVAAGAGAPAPGARNPFAAVAPGLPSMPPVAAAAAGRKDAGAGGAGDSYLYTHQHGGGHHAAGEGGDERKMGRQGQ
ncbi:hypothetical protein H9P43_009279 [Blastocladiella emersonii ATCC 22665]|nr:hypothetical protein H9P43_009279 [Blastocladiella emersonii ATCC 22665]